MPAIDASGPGRRPPRHARLAADLVAAVGRGEHPVGSRLPTEAELCRSHGLSRGTVRQALRQLEDLGLITRRAGVGSTVVSRHPATRYVPFVADRDELIAFYRTTQVPSPEVSEVVADAALADRLGTEVGAAWVLVQGARLLRSDPDAPPVGWTEQFVRPDQVPEDITPDGTAANAGALGARRIEQTVRAVSLPRRIATALGVAPRSPGLEISRRHLGHDDMLLAVSIHTHPGERFTINSILDLGD